MTPEPDPSAKRRDLYETRRAATLWPGLTAHRQRDTTLLGVARLRAKTLTGKPFTDLLAVGSLIHYETHFAPLLQLQGQLAGVTVDLVTADGSRLPVFLPPISNLIPTADQY